MIEIRSPARPLGLFAKLGTAIALAAVLSACASLPALPRITPPGQSAYLGDHPWDVKAN